MDKRDSFSFLPSRKLTPVFDELSKLLREKEITWNGVINAIVPALTAELKKCKGKIIELNLGVIEIDK